MATVTITYMLNEDGRRASLLAGGDGREVQNVTVPATPELLAVAHVAENGTASLSNGPLWNSPGTGSLGVAAKRDTGVVVEPMVLSAPPEDAGAWALETHRALLADYARLKSEAEAEWKAKALKQEQDRRALVTALVPQIVAGHGEISWNTIRVGGEKVDLTSTDPELTAVQAEKSRREDEKKERKVAEEAAKAEKAKAEREEMRAWVAEHGSNRLRMALELGVLDTLRTVYREERLAQDRPGWQWLPKNADVRTDVINPSEEHLKALAQARADVAGAPGEAPEITLVTINVDEESELSEDGEERYVWCWALKSTYFDREIIAYLGDHNCR